MRDTGRSCNPTLWKDFHMVRGLFDGTKEDSVREHNPKRRSRRINGYANAATHATQTR
jgi:hypothetical protein